MRTISTVVGLVAMLAASTAAQDAGRANPSLLRARFSKLPIYFIENRGVCPDEVAYYIQGVDKTLYFTKDGITFRLAGKDQGWVVKLDFVGAVPNAVPRGEDRQPAVISYFKGPEKDWTTGLPTCSRILYEDLWPGIRLTYKGNVNRLKYEFVVKPRADPGMIRLRYRGATSVTLTEAGALRVETPEGGFEDTPPVAWQDAGGERVPVRVAYAPGDGGSFGFEVGDYDRTRPLVLDPAVLVYCGYIGGVSWDLGYDVAVDAGGNAYVTGWTVSDPKSFPVKVGPDLSFNGGAPPGDAYVAKVNAQGTALVYCGYIGGSNSDQGEGIAVDAAGNAYVTGWTSSDEKTFPVRVGPDLTSNGVEDAFVAKVNAQGTALIYSGYIGGSGKDYAYDIAVDAAGNAYVTGETISGEATFPVTVGPDLTHNGHVLVSIPDAFVAKVQAAGTGLAYCGYIGGKGSDYGYGIAVDAAGNAFVTGETSSDESSFPVTVGPDLTFNGSQDGYVAKVNATGTALAYCGYIGGSGNDSGRGIAADAAGNAYVTGVTVSDEKTFPVTAGPDLTFNGSQDAFVAKVDAAGTAFVYCGYIGGSSDDHGEDIAVDQAGSAYLTGAAQSDEKSFPVKLGPDLTYNGGLQDAFVAKVHAQGRLLVYCGYIGGSDGDGGYGVAVDAVGNTCLVGYTLSTEKTFPVKAGPDLTYNSGPHDVFVAKIALTLLEGTGTPRPGGTVSLTLTATDDAALPYQLGTSLGKGPIPIDSRTLELSPDSLLVVSVMGSWPSVFSSYRGVIDLKGQAQAATIIPNLPALVGVRLHSAFVTLSSSAPSGIRSISNTFSFSIAK